MKSADDRTDASRHRFDASSVFVIISTSAALVYFGYGVINFYLRR